MSQEQPPAPTAAARSAAEEANPYAAPSGQAAAPFELSPRTLSPQPVTFDQLMSRSWTTLKENWVQVLLFGLILIAMQIAGQIVAIPLTLVQSFGPQTVTFIGMMVIIQQLWGMVVNGVIFAVSCRYVALLLRGDPEPIQQMFQVLPFVVRSILLQLLFILMVFAILATCAIPAGAVYLLTQDVAATVAAGIAGGLVYVVLSLFVFVRMAVAQFLIVEQNQTTMQAISESGLFLRGNSAAAALALFATGVLGIFVSVFTCGLGFLFYIPYLWLFLGVLYMSITGAWPPKKATSTPTTGPFRED
jgi:hypothetical protein